MLRLLLLQTHIDNWLYLQCSWSCCHLFDDNIPITRKLSEVLGAVQLYETWGQAHWKSFSCFICLPLIVVDINVGFDANLTSLQLVWFYLRHYPGAGKRNNQPLNKEEQNALKQPVYLRWALFLTVNDANLIHSHLSFSNFDFCSCY